MLAATHVRVVQTVREEKYAPIFKFDEEIAADEQCEEVEEIDVAAESLRRLRMMDARAPFQTPLNSALKYSILSMLRDSPEKFARLRQHRLAQERVLQHLLRQRSIHVPLGFKKNTQKSIESKKLIVTLPARRRITPVQKYKPTHSTNTARRSQRLMSNLGVY